MLVAELDRVLGIVDPIDVAVGAIKARCQGHGAGGLVLSSLGARSRPLWSKYRGRRGPQVLPDMFGRESREHFEAEDDVTEVPKSEL